MKKFFYIFVSLLVSYSAVFAQATVSGSQGVGTMIDMSDPVGIINGKAMSPAVLLNSPYLFEDFQTGTFGFRGRALNYPINIDLLANSLDIIYKSDTIFVDMDKVEYIKSTLDEDSVRIYSNVEAENSERFKGVFIQLVDGFYSLYLNKYSKLNDPDFDPRFNVGSKDYSITHLEQLLVVKDGKVFELANKAKRDKELYGEDLNSVRSLVSENGWDYKNQDDLINLYEALNRMN
jgi:hypothetical protein